MPATVATTTVGPTATMKPTASTVESSTAMEATTAAVEPSSTIKSATALKTLAGESSASKTVTVPPAPAEAPAAVKPAAVKARASIKSVKPWARTDEYAIREPIRAIVAIRSARVRVITIVAVGTYRRRAIVTRTIVSRTHSYAHKHSLRARKRCAKEANPEYRCNP
jgi:hypothetical protein